MARGQNVARLENHTFVGRAPRPTPEESNRRPRVDGEEAREEMRRTILRGALRLPWQVRKKENLPRRRRQRNSGPTGHVAPRYSKAKPTMPYAVTSIVRSTPSADLSAPTSCGGCGRYVVDRAKKIIANGFATARARRPSTRPSKLPDTPVPTTRVWPSPPRSIPTTKPAPTAGPTTRITARRVALAKILKPAYQGPGKLK